MAGFSLYKLFMLLELHEFDILCMQEMWLPPASVTPIIPGYILYE